MNRKGFTLVELLIVLAILAILAALFIPMIDGNEAHGADFKPVLATDATIQSTATTLGSQPNLNVKVMTYLASWTHDGMDPHMDRAQVVRNALMDNGVTNNRINMLYANKAGLESTPVEGGKPAAELPDSDGVYLLIY